MFLDLTRVFKNEDETLYFDEVIKDIDISTSVSEIIIDSAHVNGVFKNRFGIITFRYNLSASYVLPCDRCTKATKFSVNEDLEHELVNREKDNTDFDAVYVPENKLDIIEMVENDIILNMRTKHLCKDDCKGLCPKCGHDLNEGDCNCRKKDVDPRLSKLLEFYD